MNNYETAKKFWDRPTYPEYENIKARRLHELNYLVPKLEGCKTLLDLGCGDGALIKCLRELTEIETFIGYDYSGLMATLLPHEDTYIGRYDCTQPTELPETDVIVCAGVFNFLFDDEQVINMLKYMKAPRIFLRVIVTLEPVDQMINHFSDQLGEQYACRYRTMHNWISLIKQTHKFRETVRIYPDELESKFNTQQYYFEIY